MTAGLYVACLTTIKTYTTSTATEPKKGVSRYLVRRVPAEGVLVNVPRELDVGPAAVELLLVLDRQLQHQVLALVGEGLVKLSRQSVKPVA